MNTDKLIQMLSSEPTNGNSHLIGSRLFGFVLLGGLISFLLMFFVLGIQADLLERLWTLHFG